MYNQINLKELQGSEKQVAWAESLRNGLVKGFKLYVAEWDNFKQENIGTANEEKLKEISPEVEKFLNDIKEGLIEREYAKDFIKGEINYKEYGKCKNDKEMLFIFRENLQEYESILQYNNINKEAKIPQFLINFNVYLKNKAN